VALIQGGVGDGDDLVSLSSLYYEPLWVFTRRADSERLSRRDRFLTGITLPEGVVDLQSNIPDRVVTLLATTANLVATRHLHPALTDLLIHAAQEVHGEGGVLESPDQFPTPRLLAFPLSPEAERYYKYGPSFLQRYLPFWAATFVDRMKVMLVPLLALLYPSVPDPASGLPLAGALPDLPSLSRAGDAGAGNEGLRWIRLRERSLGSAGAHRGQGREAQGPPRLFESPVQPQIAHRPGTRGAAAKPQNGNSHLRAAPCGVTGRQVAPEIAPRDAATAKTARASPGPRLAAIDCSSVQSSPGHGRRGGRGKSNLVQIGGPQQAAPDGRHVQQLF